MTCVPLSDTSGFMPARGIVSRFANMRLGGLQDGYGFRAKRHSVRQLSGTAKLEADRKTQHVMSEAWLLLPCIHP